MDQATSAKRRRKNADADVAAAAVSAGSDEGKTGRTRRAASKKDDVTVDNGAVADSNGGQEPPKRGRGRPKKTVAEDKDASSAQAPSLADGLPATKPKRGAAKKDNDSDANADVTDTKNGQASADTAPKRGRKRTAIQAADSTDANADTDKPADAAARKGRGKSKKADDADTDSKTADNGSTSDQSNGKSAPPKIKTVTIKGKAPVDEFCSIKHKAHVYCCGDDIYDVMLNQTNLQNNNNKYYVIQLLEDDSGNAYSVWQRWGRVGYDGQKSLNTYGTGLQAAKNAFEKKFYDKTGNQWEQRASFEKRAGKYDLVQIDYSSKDDKEDEAKATEPKKPKDPPPPSKLPMSVQDLLNLICDVKAMENAVKEMKYDATKAPLGKLTTAQIKAGYAALKDIEECIQKKDSGSNLTHFCNVFYTRIPHYFGFKTPPLIRTMEEIQEKIQLLDALSDIEVAMRTLAAGDQEPDNLNPVDKHYDAMKCDLDELKKESDEFKLLEKYLTLTHGATHNMYDLELLDAFRCVKDGEESKFKDLGNKMLLWHGSRLTNWYGILSQGLRIAPPEAPVTGYMFGKGVYFADMSSKSANYCFTTREKNVGLLVLCEVALGKTRDLVNADYNADKLPAGCGSTKGLGRTVPDASGYVTLDNGCVVPCGKPKDVTTNAYLQYNEYIVYDTAQIKMKYLLKVKFNYKY